MALALLAIYCGASAPFSLQNVAATRIHDVPMYWSRYYLSEMLIIHVAAVGLSVLVFVRMVGFFIKNVQSWLVAFTAAAVCINIPALTFSIGTAYLQGAGDLYEFLLDSAADRRVFIYGRKSVKLYSSYDSLKMIEQLPFVRSASLRNYDTASASLTTLPNGSRVICINLPECEGIAGLTKIGWISRSLRWDIQSGRYTNLAPQQRLWTIVAYDVQR